MTKQLSHVDEALALATMDITAKLMPQGWDVVNDVPDSLEGIVRYFVEHGKVAVSNYFGSDTLFGCPKHSQAFNAWHDYRHITQLGAFDRPGERLVDDAMHADLLKWWEESKTPITSAAYQRASMILTVHNVGRLDFWHAYGEAPENPRQFALGFLTARGLIEIPTHCHQDMILDHQYPRELREEPVSVCIEILRQLR